MHDSLQVKEGHRIFLSNLEMHLSQHPDYKELGLPTFADIKQGNEVMRFTTDDNPFANYIKKEHERGLKWSRDGEKFEKRLFKYYSTPTDVIISKNWTPMKTTLTIILIDGENHSLISKEDMSSDRVDVFVPGGHREPNEFERDIIRLVEESKYFTEIPGDNIYE